MRLANDFLIVEHFDIPSFRISIFNLKNYKNERLFTLDFNERRLDEEKLLEIYHKPLTIPILTSESLGIEPS